MNKYIFVIIHWFAALSLLLLIACGGSSEPELTWTSGVFEDENNFKNLCQIPRSGTDVNGDSFDDQQGSSLHERHFLRSWSNNTYLWYNEINDSDPAQTTSTADYFDLLVTTAITASGTAKDQFHFTYPSDEWLQLTQSGVSAGYGAQWTIIESSPPREIRVAYTEPNSPATDANILRGAEVIQVDGVDVINGGNQSDVDLINAALFPSAANESHNFVLRDFDSNETRSIDLTSANITSTPVQSVTSFDTNSGRVGYLLFNSHIQTSEIGLINAIEQLSNDDVTDLVLDLRYNGGGLLAIASQLAYMIAGSEVTSDKTFEEIEFNDKHNSINPVTGQNLTPTPFYDQSLGFSVTAGQALPSLNLNRVFILSTARTCSASEAIINGLRGAGVEVVLIGSTTCGKPYGFYPTDNCGTTYFTIQFKGVNEMDFGDYSDGFSPMNTIGTVGELITGCSVADDFSKPLGNIEEAQLAAALGYGESNTCPIPTKQVSIRSPKEQSEMIGSLFNSEIYRRYNWISNNRYFRLH